MWRLVEAGWRCRYEPAASCTTARVGRGAALVAQRVAYGSSAAALSPRHPGALAPVRISGWSGAAWALLAAGRPVAGRRAWPAARRWP